MDFFTLLSESSCAYQDDELISGIRRVLEHISEIQNSKDYTEASFADLAASGASLLQQLLNNVDIDDLQEIENSLEVVAKSPCFLKKLPSPDIVASAEKQKSSCSLFQRGKAVKNQHRTLLPFSDKTIFRQKVIKLRLSFICSCR